MLISGTRDLIDLPSTFKSVCNVPKKPFLNSFSISDEILSKFGVRGTHEYQIKGLRTMGSEWPDKRVRTAFGSMARGGGWGFFSCGHPP